MAIRWYSTVIDSRDPQAQARWWAEVLGWQLFYDTPDEAVVIPAHYDEETARATPWDRVGPGLVFVRVPDDKQVKNRLHLDLAPHLSDDRNAEIERLLEMGATRADVGQPVDATFDVFRDPEGNEFCLLSSREN
jgi:predicted enzyme related to lactoylglutathione lyase